MKELLKQVKTALYVDEFNRLSILLGGGGALICYLIWIKLSNSENFIFFTPYGYYPLQVFLAVWLMHVIIAVYSYKIDKFISYLMTASLIFYSILIIVLEFYYWASL